MSCVVSPEILNIYMVSHRYSQAAAGKFYLIKSPSIWDFFTFLRHSNIKLRLGLKIFGNFSKTKKKVLMGQKIRVRSSEISILPH